MNNALSLMNNSKLAATANMLHIKLKNNAPVLQVQWIMTNITDEYTQVRHLIVVQTQHACSYVFVYLPGKMNKVDLCRMKTTINMANIPCRCRGQPYKNALLKFPPPKFHSIQ